MKCENPNPLDHFNRPSEQLLDEIRSSTMNVITEAVLVNQFMEHDDMDDALNCIETAISTLEDIRSKIESLHKESPSAASAISASKS
ncbi:MAG TPA: hypothetical protein VEH27_14430 [Methylomirabilota bacterium]|nr:hypothetical protein [Methylomirabilota bacterium]